MTRLPLEKLSTTITGRTRQPREQPVSKMLSVGKQAAFDPRMAQYAPQHSNPSLAAGGHDPAHDLIGKKIFSAAARRALPRMHILADVR